MSAITYSRKIAFVAALAIAFVALLAFLIWSSRDSEGGFSVAEALSQTCGELDRGHYKVTIVAAEPGDPGTIWIAEMESSPAASRLRVVYFAESSQEVTITETPVEVQRLPAYEVDIEQIHIDDRVYTRDNIRLTGANSESGTWTVEEASAVDVHTLAVVDSLAAWRPTVEELAEQDDFALGWEDTPTEMDNVRRYSRQLTLTPSEGRMDIWFDEGSATLLRHRTTYLQADGNDGDLSKVLAVSELTFSDIGLLNEIAEPTAG